MTVNELIRRLEEIRDMGYGEATVCYMDSDPRCGGDIVSADPPGHSTE